MLLRNLRYWPICR